MKNKPNIKDDFYNYINFDYFKKTKIPKGHSRWASYYQLADQNRQNLRKNIFDIRIKNSNENIDLQNAYEFYDQIIDLKSREKIGLDPVKKLLKPILDFKEINNLESLFLEYFHLTYESLFFDFSISPDAKDSNKNIIYISSNGLIMGNRDYYFDETENAKKIRNAYKIYLKNLLKAYGLFSDKRIENTFIIEKEIAKNILKNEEYRDPYILYNIKNVKDLKKYFSIWNWNNIFKTLGIENQKNVSIAELKYFKNIENIINSFSFIQIKDYLITYLIVNLSTYLNKKISKINFEFAQAFNGVKKQKSLNERAYSNTEAIFGEIIGKEFIKKWFSKEAKDDVLNMTSAMIDEYKIMINNCHWMSEKAKSSAIKKLETITIKIGYPDKWYDYSQLKIKPKSEFGKIYENTFEIDKWKYHCSLMELNKPVDKTKWFMNPQTVNAYYNPSSNEICFPAGILQKPFYDKNFSIEKKYAAIGSIIGHEISHAFDDEGCEFDEKGNLNKWWTNNDYKNYTNLSKGLEEQFSSYSIYGENINGKLTLGENIADLVGLTVAMQTARKIKSNFDYKEFFSYFAQAERVLSTKDALISQIKTDPHSPSEFRVNGVLVNINEFIDTFEINESDKMFKDVKKRIKIF